MKSFVFKNPQSAEVYYWLKRAYPDICEDFRTRVIGEGDLSESGFSPARILECGICEKLSKDVDDFVWAENFMPDWSDLVATIVRRELDAVDYREIACAVLMNADAPAAAPIGEVV